MTSSTEVFVDMMANGMAVKPAVLADALNAGKDVFLRARQSLGHLPPAPETPAPATLAEAQQLVAEKQQAVLHKEPKQKQKKKEHTPGEAFPGSRVGGANGNSAYWTLVEEYFRDVTRQDVLNLLAFCIDPDEDDALLVPQLGRPAEDALQPQPPLHLSSATAAKAARTVVPATHVSVGAAASDDGDDAYEVKRSSRLSAKAQRRIETAYSRPDNGPGRISPADQYSRDSQGYAAPALRPVSSPYCLLDQLPAADLLLMVNVSMLLQQMSIVDLAAALGPNFAADDLAVLIDQALQPQSMPVPGAAVTARGISDPYDDAARVVGGFQALRAGYGGLPTMGGAVYDVHNSLLKPQKSSRQKDKEAAAANAWAYVSAGVGGPQLTEQQRGVLVAWLQQQCGTPGVGDGRLGPIAAPWVPPSTLAVDAAATNLSTATAAAEMAAQSAAGVDASAAAGSAGTAEDVAGSLQQQEQQAKQPLMQQQEEPAGGADATPNPAADLTANHAGTAAAADDSALALAAADAGQAPAAALAAPDETASGAANIAVGAAAAEQQQLQQVNCVQAVGPDAVTVVDTATAINPAAAPTAQAARSAVAEPAADPYDENLARLAIDAKKRADRRAAELMRRRLEARLELHPYIKALLQRPLPPHIADPGWDMQETLLGDDEPDDATAAGTSAGGAAISNSKSSAAANKKAGTPAADSSAAVDEFAGAETDAAGLPPSGSSGKAKSVGARGRSRGKVKGKKGGAARGGKAAGAAAAGKAAGGAGASGSGAAASAAGDGRGAAAGKADDRAPQSAAAQAVAAIIAGAPVEGSLDQQWAVLDSSADVLALAPDDEVLAELLTLQGELLQQMAINRARLGVVLQSAMDDVPNQQAAQAERATWEADVVSYMTAVREARKAAKREKREQERRQAVEEAAAMLPLSPRHTAARASRAARESSYGGDRGGDWVGGSEDFEDNTERGVSPAVAATRGTAANQAANEDVLGADGAPLIDALSSRANDDALCSICSEGHSEPPNQIIFCERCDVAVHQVCYGVDAIPEGEWLCWPCLQYEEQMRRQGLNQADIRPPRWMGVGHTGGGRNVQCTLCPMHCGAFKQFNDGSKRWVHVVCALWHPDTKMPLDVNEAEVVTGSDRLEERLATPNQQLCQVCRRPQGAAVKCSFGHCATTFHPLCGRARGWYLAIRAGSKSGTYQYKAYCAAHSDAQRQKDREAAERAVLLAQGLVPVIDAPKASRRGRPPAGAFSMEDYDDSADLLPTPTAAAPVLPPPVEIDPAVLQATALKEKKIWMLLGVRFELETLRMLADQVKRREKIKVQCARASSEVHESRLEDPAAGLEQLTAEMLENAATAAAIPDRSDDTAAPPGDDTVTELAAAVAGFGSTEAVGDADLGVFGTDVRPAGQELAGDPDQLQQQLLSQQDRGPLHPVGAAAAADVDEAVSVAAGLEDALSMLQALAAAEPAPAAAAAAAAESPGLPKALSPASIDAMVKRAAAVNGAAAVFEPAAGPVFDVQVGDQQQAESEQQLRVTEPAAAAEPPAAAAAEGSAAMGGTPQQVPDVTAAAAPAATQLPAAAAAAELMQQQESQDIAVLESPTAAGVGSSKRARKPTAAASAAAKEAAAVAAAGGKGGKPPLAGNKRARGAPAAAAAGADSAAEAHQQDQQQQTSTLGAPSAADSHSQKLTAAAVAADTAMHIAAAAAAVPVPAVAAVKRRRTSGAAAGRRAAAATAATGQESAAAGDVAAAAETALAGQPEIRTAVASGQSRTAAAGVKDQQRDQQQQASAAGQPGAAAAAAAGDSTAMPAAAASPQQGLAEATPAVNAEQQRHKPAAGSSKPLGSRKRARPADGGSTAAAAAKVRSVAAEPHHPAAGAAEQQEPPVAAAATNTSADATAAGQPSTEAAAAAAAPPAQQQPANHKSQQRPVERKGPPAKRSTAKELAMLQDQLKNSFFHPVGGPRSRRPSRDGSGGGAADATAAAEDEQQPQQQQQQVLERISEATDTQENQQQQKQEKDDELSIEDERLVNVAAAAAALAETFSSSDDAAVGDGDGATAADAAVAAAAAAGKQATAAAEAPADVAGTAAVNCLSPRPSGGGRKPRVSKSGKGSKQQQQRASPGPNTRSSPGPEHTASKAT